MPRYGRLGRARYAAAQSIIDFVYHQHRPRIIRFPIGRSAPPSFRMDSPLKSPVDEATCLLDAFREEDEENFRTAVEEIDQRILASTQGFFDLMCRSGATMRLVVGTA